MGPLVATVAEIRARGVRSFAIQGDMATPAGAEATSRAVLEHRCLPRHPDQQCRQPLAEPGRPGRPEEISPLTPYLASPASSYVTGASFVVFGGHTV